MIGTDLVPHLTDVAPETELVLVGHGDGALTLSVHLDKGMPRPQLNN